VVGAKKAFTASLDADAVLAGEPEDHALADGEDRRGEIGRCLIEVSIGAYCRPREVGRPLRPLWRRKRFRKAQSGRLSEWVVADKPVTESVTSLVQVDDAVEPQAQQGYFVVGSLAPRRAFRYVWHLRPSFIRHPSACRLGVANFFSHGGLPHI
jgi:hypothetical protein